VLDANPRGRAANHNNESKVLYTQGFEVGLEPWRGASASSNPAVAIRTTCSSGERGSQESENDLRIHRVYGLSTGSETVLLFTLRIAATLSKQSSWINAGNESQLQLADSSSCSSGPNLFPSSGLLPGTGFIDKPDAR
jgi:hypothetical protein